MRIEGHPISGARLVAIVCSAQVLVQIGAFFWPALLPQMIQRWQLSNSEAGWITSAFYGAYMVAVPVLVTLTDRVDARRVYLFGVGCSALAHVLFGLVADGFWTALLLRALAGIGWAGTYMTGLKLLADQVDEKMMSRAVTGHAAGIGISGALSYIAGDFLADQFGWRAAFAIGGGTAAAAWLSVALLVPGRSIPRHPGGPALFDFRPVLRNRSAMAYALAYCAHTLEMNTLRGWGVAFLAWIAAQTGRIDDALSPTVVITALGLIGTAASVVGNEASIRFGRRRLIVASMLLSIALGAVLGLLGTLSYAAAIALVIAYGLVIWLDSSSLTAGTAGTAEPSRRGATLAVHSMLGYGGGFIGPIAMGWTLDLAGGMSVYAWWLGFLVVAAFMALALAIFIALQPRGLAGEVS
ncbi:Predicted arabinose efflux permease, MFS family [Enhydrobacter aerosaccus]|uniref:Predicted arabinose efflux permease, MFS family n=1 Tax=Enhydrobacter aerosaccus TaxID=225324 RepID=A0A1T4RYJ7_9HYPH|nr:MFS transporter [Enhydrobacter aerosaccus]SKA21080.1 Predicted arabinose efflux permease, MFS family [Enhydrobacter aerosaccus]